MDMSVKYFLNLYKGNIYEGSVRMEWKFMNIMWVMRTII